MKGQISILFQYSQRVCSIKLLCNKLCQCQKNDCAWFMFLAVNLLHGFLTNTALSSPMAPKNSFAMVTKWNWVMNSDCFPILHCFALTVTCVKFLAALWKQLGARVWFIIVIIIIINSSSIFLSNFISYLCVRCVLLMPGIKNKMVCFPARMEIIKWLNSAHF